MIASTFFCDSRHVWARLLACGKGLPPWRTRKHSQIIKDVELLLRKWLQFNGAPFLRAHSKRRYPNLWRFLRHALWAAVRTDPRIERVNLQSWKQFVVHGSFFMIAGSGRWMCTFTTLFKQPSHQLQSSQYQRWLLEIVWSWLYLHFVP